MKQYLFNTLLVFITFVTLGYAQEYQVTGQVFDQEQSPIVGVNVFVKNSNLGTYTNEEGQFELNFKNTGDYELIVSYLGYDNQTFPVTVGASTNPPVSITLEKNAFDLDAVTITTNREAELINEVPSTVSVITPAEFQQISSFTNTLADILAYVPGVGLSTNTTTTRGQNIRGRNMLVLVDGIPQSTPLFITNRDLNALSPEVVERVEVLKGANAIYGNGAEGGTINYITKRGNTSKAIESSTSIGTMGSLVNTDHTFGTTFSQQFKGQVGKLNYILNGSYQETGVLRSADGDILSPFYGLGETEWYNGFVKLGYDLNENNSLEVMYNYFSSRQSTNLNRVNGVYGETAVTGVFGETSELETDQGTRYNNNFKISFNSKNIFRNTDLTLDAYAQDFQTIYGYSTFFQDITSDIAGGQSQVESTKRGIRLNLNTRFLFSDDIAGNVLYGIDYMGDLTRQSLVDGRTYVPNMDMNNLAPYAQLKFNIQDFVLRAGTRFENINIAIDDYTTLYRNTGSREGGGVAILGDELSYNALVFNAGLRYNKFKVLQPYLSYSQSFSVGQLGRILRGATDPNIVRDRIDTEAIIANNYEIGIASELTERIRFRGSAFMSMSELGAEFIENETTGILEAARRPEQIIGAELQLDTKISSQIDFGISASFIEGQADLNEDGEFGEDEYLNGLRINPTIIRGYIAYRPLDNWNLRLFSTYSGARNRFETRDNGTYAYGNGPVNSFFVTSLSTSYILTPQTRLSLGIENLFNADYYTVRSQWAARDRQYEKGNGINFRLALNVNL
ncbi:MAG: TonB-dependent receptor [Bacteroidota bacterium]